MSSSRQSRANLSWAPRRRMGVVGRVRRRRGRKPYRRSWSQSGQLFLDTSECNEGPNTILRFRVLHTTSFCKLCFCRGSKLKASYQKKVSSNAIVRPTVSTGMDMCVSLISLIVLFCSVHCPMSKESLCRNADQTTCLHLVARTHPLSRPPTQAQDIGRLPTPIKMNKLRYSFPVCKIANTENGSLVTLHPPKPLLQPPGSNPSRTSPIKTPTTPLSQ